MIKAIVFDLDGVLLDAADWHFQAFHRSLASVGFQLSPSDHARHFNGLPTRVKLDLLSRQRNLPREWHGRLNQLKQKYTREILEEECGVDLKVVTLLEVLKSRGLKLAVATNSGRDTLELVLRKMKIRNFFDVCCSHEDVGESKPSPAIYLHTFRQLQVNPRGCLVIEDSAPGIEAAEASGANVLTVPDPSKVTLSKIEREINLLNAAVQIPQAAALSIPHFG